MDCPNTPIVIGFATTNPHKIQETQACLAALLPQVQVVPLVPPIPVAETGETLAENAMMKLQACRKAPLPEAVTHVMAEDSGLLIPALDGTLGLSPFPGVRSDRWLTAAMQETLFRTVVDNPDYPLKNRAILALMENQADRRAYYASWVACWCRHTEAEMTCQGQVALQVARTPSGHNGFGYDPIMIPEQGDRLRTMAELSPEAKNRISHRYEALTQVAAFIRQQDAVLKANGSHIG